MLGTSAQHPWLQPGSWHASHPECPGPQTRGGRPRKRSAPTVSPLGIEEVGGERALSHHSKSRNSIFQQRNISSLETWPLWTTLTRTHTQFPTHNHWASATHTLFKRDFHSFTHCNVYVQFCLCAPDYTKPLFWLCVCFTLFAIALPGLLCLLITLLFAHFWASLWNCLPVFSLKTLLKLHLHPSLPLIIWHK